MDKWGRGIKYVGTTRIVGIARLKVCQALTPRRTNGNGLTATLCKRSFAKKTSITCVFVSVKLCTQKCQIIPACSQMNTNPKTSVTIKTPTFVFLLIFFFSSFSCFFFFYYFFSVLLPIIQDRWFSHTLPFICSQFIYFLSNTCAKFYHLSLLAITFLYYVPQSRLLFC